VKLNTAKICRLTLGLTLTGVFAAAPAQSATLSAHSEAAKAVRRGPAAVQAALTRAGTRRDTDLAEALLGYAETHTVRGQAAPTGEVSALTAAPTFCRGRAFSRHRLSIAGVTLLTQTVFQNGFCWRNLRVVSSEGQSVRRWAAFLYCWTNTSEGEYWTRRSVPGLPDRKRAWAQAQAGIDTGLGCIPAQRDRPIVDFNGVGQLRWR